METLRERNDGGETRDREAYVARLAWAGVLLWVVIGCVLRVSGLDAYALSPDDALHVAEARLTFPIEILEALAREDTHPPVHYLLLRALISLGIEGTGLRILSLLPSLLLIPLLYVLGHRIAGRTAGLFAGFMATFSAPLIVQAQVIRPYALELFFLAGALCFVFDDRERGARARLAGYGGLAALAIFTHYSAVISVAAVASVLLFHLLRARRARAAFDWMLLHALLAALTALLVWLLASLLLDSGFRRDAVGGWLDVGFPESRYFASWLGGTLAQFIYFADPPHVLPGLLLGALFMAGCVALRGDDRLQLAQMWLVASGLNLALAALALYPFAGTRHAVYLIPFVAPICGTGFQWLWRKAVESTASTEFIGVAVFAVSTLLAFFYVDPAAVRRVTGMAELPLLRAHYEKTLDYIEVSLAPGEILLGDKQLAYYAWYEHSMRDAERLSDVVGRTRLGSHEFYYYDPAFQINGAEDLAHFVDAIEGVLGSRPERLRFASLGWRSGLLFRLAAPDMAGANPQPGDRALRDALSRAKTPAFSVGNQVGGGVVFPVNWETLSGTPNEDEPGSTRPPARSREPVGDLEDARPRR